MTPLRTWKIVRIALTAAYLMGGWLLFTASLQPRSLLLGALFSLLVALLTYSLFLDESETHRRSIIPHVHWLPVYFVLLILKMYAASFSMLWRIATRRINPRVVHFRTRLKSDIARVVLTNSITLTPGTITLLLDDDHLVVHWLDARTRHTRHANHLIAGPFERLLARIWI